MDIANVKLVVGCQLEIEIPNKNNDNSPMFLKSQMLDILDNEHYLIAAPILHNNYYFLERNTSYQIFFTTEEKGLCSFWARVIKKGNINKAIYYKIKRLDDFKINQRRTFYRLPFVRRIHYRVQDPNNTNDNTIKITFDKTPNMKKAWTKNISGSGVCIVIEENIKPNDILEVVLPIDNEYLTVKCKVERKTEIEIENIKKYELGLSYIDLSESDCNKLIKFIFKQQRLLIQARKDSL